MHSRAPRRATGCDPGRGTRRRPDRLARPGTELDTELGGIVTGWLVRIVAIAAVIGLVGFDGLSLMTARLGVIDQGQHAARAASSAWRDSNQDIQTAYNAAATAAAEADPHNTIDTESFVVAQDGTVSLRIDREATTLVLHRIKPLRTWIVISEDVSGRTIH